MFLPSNVPFAKQLLDSDPDCDGRMSGRFPGWRCGVTTETKVSEMKQCFELGADEVDAVMNIGWLRSGRYAETKRRY